MKIYKTLAAFTLALSFLSAPLNGFAKNVSADEISGLNADSKTFLTDMYYSGSIQDEGISQILYKGDGSVDEKTYWSRMGSKFYYNKMNKTEKAFYDKCCETCNYYLLNDTDLDDSIIIDVAEFDLDRDTIDKVWDICRYSNPQLFFTTYICSYSGYAGSDKVYKIGLKVSEDFNTGAERKAAKQKIKSAVNEYLNDASVSVYPEEKEHKVFERMCSKISYSNDAANGSNIYGAVSGSANHVGYAMLFSALMNSVGNDCPVLFGMGPNTNRYFRNMINLHGYWYCVNVSQADQATNKYKYYNYSEIIDSNIDRVIFDYVLDMWFYDDLYSETEYTSRYFTYNNVVYFIPMENSYWKALPLNESYALPMKAKYNNRTYQVIRPEGLRWVYDNDVWFYLDDYDNYVKGWKKIDGNWYYFKNYMYEGFHSIDGYTYFFGENGIMRTGWVLYDGDWFYFGTDGIMKAGWQKINGSWYYFHSYGFMMKNWQNINDVWYYFGDSGVMRVGWQKISGQWYYFSGTGAMMKEWQQIGGKWYYFGGNGIMRTDWQKIGGKWYYFGDSGVMRIGWAQANGKWYYFESNGSMKTGWLNLGGYWYYLDPSSGAMATGSRSIGGKTYKFDSNGKCTNP